jgi:hypothetical protein
MRPRRLAIRSRTIRIWWGSRPIVGSSMMMTGGSASTDSAMPTRWRNPFESLPMILWRTRFRSHSSRTSSILDPSLLRGTSFSLPRKYRYSLTRMSSGRGLFSGM